MFEKLSSFFENENAPVNDEGEEKEGSDISRRDAMKRITKGVLATYAALNLPLSGEAEASLPKQQELIKRVFHFPPQIRPPEGELNAAMIEHWRNKHTVVSSTDGKKSIGLSPDLSRGWQRLLDSKIFEITCAKCAKYNLPVDFVVLPLAESFCMLNDVSGKGAGGPWQIMEKTAIDFGLIKDGNDDRFDPKKSTDAALHILEQNYQFTLNWDRKLGFDSRTISHHDRWHFAMSLYNGTYSEVKNLYTLLKGQFRDYAKNRINLEST